MKKHNFGAGPCILPQEVFEQAAKGVMELDNEGLSVLEISHRSKAFLGILEQTKDVFKRLLKLNDDYKVLFFQGGASLQFMAIAQNFLNTKACYIDTGAWSSKSIKEAKNFGDIDVIASSKDKNYNYIPKNYTVDPKADYLHFTSNNTIYGTQFKKFPKTGLPLICDMSSDFMSREIDVTDFSLIYAGAQKNVGPAGIAVVIIKESLLDLVKKSIPPMISYKTFIDNNSLYNTPSVFSIYVAMLNMLHLEKIGGIAAQEKLNNEKASLLYDEIDRNPLFVGTAEKEDRSNMNVCFLLKDDSKTEDFTKLCKSANIEGITGHRSVGGFRASIYNAMKISSIQVLVDLMKEFEKK